MGGDDAPFSALSMLYQQNGKTFAIWQFNDRVSPPTRLRVSSGTELLFPQR
jgi:hypothetical protein